MSIPKLLAYLDLQEAKFICFLFCHNRWKKKHLKWQTGSPTIHL
jgi:hypothetical protein